MNPRIERKITRISGVREVKQTFLIICEGVNTEPDYFNAFRLTSATVKAIGQGMGTLALVQKAINIKEQERQRGSSFPWITRLVQISAVPRTVMAAYSRSSSQRSISRTPGPARR